MSIGLGDLDTVIKLYSADHLRQPVVAAQAVSASAHPGGLRQLDDHRQCGLFGKALRSSRPFGAGRDRRGGGGARRRAAGCGWPMNPRNAGFRSHRPAGGCARLRRDLGTMTKPPKALEAEIAREGPVPTKARVAAPGKVKARKQPRGEFERDRPG